MDTRTFRESEEKQQQSRLSFLFFRLNFIVYTDLDNRETARASDKKQGRRIFFGRKTWNFYSGGEKKRNSSGHQSENKR